MGTEGDGSTAKEGWRHSYQHTAVIRHGIRIDMGIGIDPEDDDSATGSTAQLRHIFKHSYRFNDMHMQKHWYCRRWQGQ